VGVSGRSRSRIKRVAICGGAHVTEPRFKPWVGRNYGRHSRWKQSVLILGESHYDESYAQGDRLTEYVVRGHVERRGKQYGFWTKIGRTLVGPQYGDGPSRRALWDSIAFYNYVQDFVGEAARQRPTPEHFRSSWRPFESVLAELQPDLVVALGFGLWGALEPLLPRRSSLGITLPGGRHGQYAVLRHAAPGAGLMGYVKHPSTGYRPADWQPVVSALMVQANRSRVEPPVTAGEPPERRVRRVPVWKRAAA